MEPIKNPEIAVTFTVDLDLDYDPFLGRTPIEFARIVEDDMRDVLMELRPEILGVYTDISKIQEYQSE